MSEFQELLLLSYVEEAASNFSYLEFASRIGSGVKAVENMIDDLVNKSLVRCGDHNVDFHLTALGKEKLIRTGVVFYNFENIVTEGVLPEKWSIDKPYVPKGFLKKL